MKELSGWENFYVIVGSSAGALIGLQFVMISLIGRLADSPEGSQAGRAFATPTVVHFTMVLGLAAIGTVPWQNTAPLTVLWCVLGLAGVAYGFRTTRRVSTQSAYRPETEDWLFHSVLPCVAYAIIGISGIYGRADLNRSLIAVAAAILLLLVIGIHNAWDAATYHVFSVRTNSKG
jgi:hypothetical protein